VSLVKEALEKAEREAAARAARERGLPEKLTAAGQPYRARRQRSPWPAAIALGGVALVATAGAWWALRRAPRPEPIATAAPAAPTATTEERPARASPAGAEPARADIAPSTDPRPAGPPEPDAPAATESAVNVPSPSMESDAPQATPAPGRRPPRTVTETHLRELTLDTGATIRLGGIAWSDAAPLAYLNGKLLGVGESVAGCRVEKIERDRVELARGERRLVLTLH